jgi:hypothetical protein
VTHESSGQGWRPSLALDMQRQALVQVLIGGVVVGSLCVGAALVRFVGLGHRSVRSIIPIVEAYMAAGSRQDVLGGHVLFSEAGLRETSPADLAARYDERELYVGYDHVRVTTFRVLLPTDQISPETAVVVATAYYDGAPTSRIDARMDLEEAGWRLRSINVTRSGP